MSYISLWEHKMNVIIFRFWQAANPRSHANFRRKEMSKSALSYVLILQKDFDWRAVHHQSFDLCRVMAVYCGKRISVPMSYIKFFWECGGPRADGVDLEVYFGVVLGFTFDLPHIYLRSTSSQPQVDLEVNLVGTRSQCLHITNGTWPHILGWLTVWLFRP